MEQIERDMSCKETASASEDKNGSDSLLENVNKSSDSGCEENTEVQHDLGCKEVQDDCVDGDLDPRIQIELEKLNSSTDVINKLELDLEEARSTFRHLLGESGRQLNHLQKELGQSVEKARPYYEARMKARGGLAEAQSAAARFEKASSAHDAAKEMVTLAEEGFMERGVVHFDQAWQEMLNHATKRVNESEVERNLSAEEHRVKSKSYQIAEQRVHALQRSLKRTINKSRPYFDVKARLNQSLDDQKRQIQLIEETIQMTKVGYANSLKELEKISEEIHERRKKQGSNANKDKENEKQPSIELALFGARQDGVGAEFPSPIPIEKLLKKQFSQTATEGNAENCDISKKRYTKHQRKESKMSEGHTRDHCRKKCVDGSSGNSEPDQHSNAPDARGDVDIEPLVSGDEQNPKHYECLKRKKRKKKKYHKMQSESLPTCNSTNISTTKAINSRITSKLSHTDSIKKSLNAASQSHPSVSQDKRTSISSSSTTESAGHEHISAHNSAASNKSNRSRSSPRSSSSSSTSNNSYSSESSTQPSSPKMCYESLKSQSSNTSAKLNTCGQNMGLPIHPFSTAINSSDDKNDQAKENDVMCYGENLKPLPMKPIVLTNRYLNIRQEESELSDAESLASLDPMDDSQIDQLMKEVSLQEAADVLFSSTTQSISITQTERN